MPDATQAQRIKLGCEEICRGQTHVDPLEKYLEMELNPHGAIRSKPIQVSETPSEAEEQQPTRGIRERLRSIGQSLRGLKLPPFKFSAISPIPRGPRPVFRPVII